MTIDYPTVSIPATLAGAIGNVPVIVYIAKVKATIASQPSIVFWGSLEVIIHHECLFVYFNSPTPSTITATYIVTSLPSASTA